MKRAAARIGQALQSLKLRQLAAVLICLALCMQSVPVTAFAATEIKANKVPLKGSAKQTNTYMLEISNGTQQGGGAAENVLYFVVHYTDTENTARSVVIMPGIDGKLDSYNTAAAISNRDARANIAKKYFNTEFPELQYRKALNSVKTDQLLFTTPKPVKTFNRIQIFGEKTTAQSDWTCQSMRIFSVDAIYGLDYYGWYSSDPYIDFSGEIAAEVQFSAGTGVFHWNNSGGTFNISRPQQGRSAGVVLVDKADKESYEASYRRTTNVGTRKERMSEQVVFRMKFADEAGAGLESLACSYDAGSKPALSKQEYIEVAALKIRYLDKYSCYRDVVLPLVTNSLGPVVEQYNASGEADIAIAGFAQQGDTIAVPAMLPDYASITSVSMIIGSEQAALAADMVISLSNPESKRYRRFIESRTDNISYINFAVYDDVTTTVDLGDDGATLRYSFEEGENNPILFSTATSQAGLSIPAGSEKTLTFNTYRDGVVLEPVDRTERYLVTISTDNVENAGTTSDVKMQFTYTSLKDRELTSPVYNIKDYISSFYGEWSSNTSDFAYKYTMRDGGTTQFIIPLQGVKEFKDVSFKVEGNDEWQFTGVSVALVKSVDSRAAVWKEVKFKDIHSWLEYSRKVYTQDVCFQIGDVYPDGEERPEAGGEEWEPGKLIQDDGDMHTFDGSGSQVSTKEEVDWSELRHYMSYNDALKDLGFTKERCNYKVGVKVKGDLVNTDIADEDCGSQNLFYFQLVFENGTSGCVLANQQIGGDGFRTGALVEFDIPATQDYGELTAINVIPDDQDSNSSIYDKLKIEYISVEKETTDALSPTWRAEGDPVDGLGWVGIEYRDPGEIGSNRGVRGHSLSEVATTYQITKTSYSAKFLVSISTGTYGTYPVLDNKGNMITITDPVLAGGVTMHMSYFDTSGAVQNKRGIDMIEAINDYSGRSGSKVRVVQLENEQKDVDYFVSNPNYIFRPGTTDSFFVTVEDISQFIDMTLVIRSDVVTNWTINDVNIYLVSGTGTRFLNKDGEYEYKYPDGQGLKLIAKWDRTQPLKRDLEIYRGLQDTSIAEVNFGFVEESSIDLSDIAEKWASVVPAVPSSNRDTLNLFLYPAEGEGIADPGTYNLNSAVRYIDAQTKTYTQVSAGTFRRADEYNEDGEYDHTVFYALGLNVQNFETLKGVDVETNSMKQIRVPIRYGVIQRIRGGVLIDTLYLDGVANADNGGTLMLNPVTTARSMQHVALQFSPDMKTQNLEADRKDIAVALYFYNDDPSDMELRSKYVFLTDNGLSTIRGGQVVEFDMNLGNLREVTGVNIVSIGNVEASVDAVSVVDIGAEGKVYSDLSVTHSVVPSSQVTRLADDGDAKLLTLTIKTAADEASMSSGTTGPVRMTIGYYDLYGVLQTLTYPNVRQYISSGSGFTADGTDTVKMIVPNISELRWIELEPERADGSATPASWKPETITAKLGLEGRTISRGFSQTVVEGVPLHVSVADILISGAVIIPSDYTGETAEEDMKAAEKDAANTISTGGNISRLLDSGEVMNIIADIYGSDEGILAKIESYDPVSGAVAPAKLAAKHGYTDDYLTQLRSEAQSSAESGNSAAEQDAAERVVDIIDTMVKGTGDLKKTKTGYEFTAPRNFTGRDLYYRVTVYSAELSGISFTVDVTIYSEADTLSDAITLWKTEQNNAAPQTSSEGSEGGW